nr:putative ribonuclease H-like domain-containing protein [Tanacetum cinerariifolium]
MKALKEKIEDKLLKQDQSLQIVHMLCKLKPYYDEQRKVAIGYKNPLCLTRAKNNREVHLDYLKHLKESVETLREMVEEVRVERPLDRLLASACLYTKHSQELLEYMVGTFLKTSINEIKRRLLPLLIGKYKNNREAHLDYLRHLKESVETIRDIVREAKVVRPLDSSIVSACRYTKHSQELLEYAIGCSKHMMGDHSRLMNFVKKFIGIVRFRNDHFDAIMGYGDYVISDSVISRVYYVEGLGHNLFSVEQFYDSNLEVAFIKHSYYVRDTDGVDLIKGSHGSNLYTISVEDIMKSSSICLLSKASKNKSWLWHRRLNYLNFGKSKKHTHKPKTENTNLDVLKTLHMDLCGPMRVQTINGKKYILVIIDDYSRFTWVKFLRSKDETLEIVLWYLDSGFSKHMTEDCSQLKNFMKKFIKTVRFGNDHFGAIMDYRDYVIGECDLQDGVELIKGSCGSNLYTISVEDMMKSSSICLLSKV